MRATRQTELEDLLPSHIVCAWLGNSKEVARDHYLTVTDEHFSAAAELLRRHPERTQQAAAGSGERGATSKIPGEKRKGPGMSTIPKAPRRSGRDSNPRYTFVYAGFQDRCIQPLCHPTDATAESIAPVAFSCKAAAASPTRPLALPTAAALLQLSSRRGYDATNASQ